MSRKNKVILFSGIAALALGLSLCTTSTTTDKPIEIDPDEQVYISLAPEAEESETIIQEEERIKAYTVDIVTFTDPNTGLKRKVLLKITDSWPSITAGPEEHTYFAKIKLGDTELGPKIDDAKNYAVVMQYRGINDSKVYVESQSVYSKVIDENFKTTDMGLYRKDTVYVGPVSYDTVETYVYTEGEEKQNSLVVTYYDEFDSPEVTDTLSAITVKNFSLEYGIDPSTLYTREELLIIEQKINRDLNRNFKKDL